MTRYQNNYPPAGAGWAAPQEQSAWAEEISGGVTSLEVAPGAAGTMGRPAVVDPAGQPVAPGGRLQMQSGLPADVVEAPTTREEAYLGSLKAMLSRNVGNYIVATFLVGTQNLVSWEGVLYDVGNDYLTIYQESRDRYIVSDYYSLKFMEFYDTERRKLCDSMLQSGGLPGGGWRPARG